MNYCNPRQHVWITTTSGATDTPAPGDRCTCDLYSWQEWTDLAKKDECLQSENALLRSALEAVEWIWDGDRQVCAWCYCEEPGHYDDCRRQAALKGGGA